MDTDGLVARYPTLFHMASAGSWKSIREHGLLTTQQIADSAQLDDSSRRAILSERRAETIVLDHPELGTVSIRDQAPLKLHNLHLEGVTLQEWLDILNNRVFFWLHPARLEDLLGARRYRNQEQDVLIVDTGSLLRSYGADVYLSSLNSGATIYPSAPPRGIETFQPISEYDFVKWRRSRSSDKNAIAELAVLGGVPTLHEHVLRVERRVGSVVKEVLYEK